MRVTVSKGVRSVTVECDRNDISYGTTDIDVVAEKAMKLLERLDYTHYGPDTQGKTLIPVKEEEWRELDVEGRFVDVDDRR